MDRKKRAYLFTVMLLLVTIYTIWPKAEKPKQIREIQGITMGSITYSVKLIGTTKDYKPQIDSLLEAFNNSLSTYIPDSEISRFNRDSRLDTLSPLFREVIHASTRVNEETKGAFDPTIGPLIRAWGFGPDKKVVEPDSALVDSLLLMVGFEKLKTQGNGLTKDEQVDLDFSAIAKGQAVDEVGRWLESKGEENYLVEIGGEVRTRGRNQTDSLWRIGIQDPRESLTNEQLAIAKLDNKSVATSGNYRNYYEIDGKIRAHIVDPMTGYTAEHNLLSASVFHEDCMLADAYATAFMVMGLERSVAFVESRPDLDAIFIYQVDDELDVYVSAGMANHVDLLLK